MPNFDQKIQAYLEGELDQKERITFEDQLKRDPALQKAVDEHRIAYEAVDLLVQKRIKKQLRGLQLERQQKARFTRGRRPWIIPAAAMLLLIAIAAFVLNTRSNYTDEALFAQNYKTYSADGLRSEQGNKNVLTSALVAYEGNDFASAYALLTAIQADNPNYITATFYKGMAALELKKHKEANEHFLTIIESGNAQYAEPAQWFQALSFLDNKEETMARKVLKDISKRPDNAYKQKADELLEDLNSFWH